MYILFRTRTVSSAGLGGLSPPLEGPGCRRRFGLRIHTDPRNPALLANDARRLILTLRRSTAGSPSATMGHDKICVAEVWPPQDRSQNWPFSITHQAVLGYPCCAGPRNHNCRYRSYQRRPEQAPFFCKSKFSELMWNSLQSRRKTHLGML